MTPKEKANELVNKFYVYCNNNHKRQAYAEECALIAVDEILDIGLGFMHDDIAWSIENFWLEVKQEIEKL
jgi:hypothetical protein